MQNISKFEYFLKLAWKEKRDHGAAIISFSWHTTTTSVLLATNLLLRKIISKHLKGGSVPRVSHVFAEFKGFCHFTVSSHFPYSIRTSKRSVGAPRESVTFLDHNELCRFPVSRHFPYSVTLIWAPCEWRFWITQGFCCFLPIYIDLLFLISLHWTKLFGWKVQEVLSYPLFPDTSTEASAAGARRGVCNCIRTTIPSRP